MPEFDAEYYLRRYAEDELNLDENPSAPARAKALVILGLLPLERARDIMGLYQRARALRDGEAYWDDDPDDDAPREQAPVRVVALDRTVVAPFGTVLLRYVSVGETGLRVAAKITFSKKHQAHPMMGHHHGPSLDVTDDRGTTVTLHFSGGGGNTSWRGHFSSDEGLSSTTAWIEVAGERIDLPRQDHGVTVEVHEAGEGGDLATRAAGYLEHTLRRERREHWRPSTLPAVLDTVLASGALTEGSEAVTTTRAVWTAVSRSHVADPQALPERWRSVLAPAPRRRRAPKGDVVVGAAVPAFDGVRLTVFALSSRRSQFAVELEGRGNSTDGLGSGEDDEPPFTFTAVDDLGNHFLGHTSEWGTSGTVFGGTVDYQPPLDAGATRLDLVFATPRARAVVSVPLRWEGAR